MDSNNPLKRRRPNGDSDDRPDSGSGSRPLDTISTLARNESVYIEDGTLVLAAQDVAFRVHPGVLSRHSSVFRDMFQSVSADATQEMFDGCPVVRLGDDVEAVEGLLKTLYDHGQFSPQMDLTLLLNILRLSHKYMLDSLFKLSKEALQHCFPDNFDAWNNSSLNVTPAHRNTYTLEDLALAIEVAREVNCLALMPSALLLLSRFPIEDVALLLKTSPDLLRVIQGRERLSLASQAVIFADVLAISPSSCETPHPCKQEREFTQEQLKASALGGTPFATLLPASDAPLDRLSEMSQVPNFTFGFLCNKCQLAIQAKCDKKRRKLWKFIPSFFGLVDDGLGWPADFTYNGENLNA